MSWRTAMRKPIFFMLLILVLLLSACDILSQAQVNNPPAPDLVQTYVAQTVEALAPQLATSTPSILPLPGEQATATNPPAPTNPPPQPTNTLVIPTATTKPVVLVTNTPAPTATNAIPCDRVGKVTDVTIPDGDLKAPGATFTKTWEITNTGSCTWDSGYALVFGNQGDAMNGPASKQLTTGSVAPNQKVQVSVELTAPAKTGTYRGYWKLRNKAGVVFGIGSGDTAFWVEINVGSSEYNFVNKYCSATWKGSTSSSKLACPGKSGDSNGFVIKEDKSIFGARADDEAGLWTNPPLSDNSQIKGTYPAIPIGSNSRFKAFIGCKAGATHCNVKFKIAYKADGGSEQTLGEWSADINTFTKLDIDLSSLAGKSVQFILVVKSNGASDQDQGLWMQPRITSE